MTEKMGITPPRHSPKTMLVGKDDYFRLKIDSGKQALLLLRWLLTKFYRSGRKYSDEELAICYLLGQYIDSYSNQGFIKKHYFELLKLRVLFQMSLKTRALYRWEEKQVELVLSQHVLMSPRAFLSLPANFANGFLRRVNLRLKQPHPPLRRIGVGYRDKGHAHFSAIDGSPRWEEVALVMERKQETVYRPHRVKVPDFLIPEPPGRE